MKFEYINKDGNRAITEDVTLCPENLIKIDWVYFEKTEEVVIKKTKSVIETKEEDLGETVVEIAGNDEAYLAFLKEKKIRGAHLLKGDKLKDKAISEGFNS